MNYKQFKLQPVAAFYQLLANSILHLLTITFFAALIDFLAVKYLVLGQLGNKGIDRLAGILKAQQASPADFKTHSKAMEEFLIAYPSIVSLTLLVLLLSVVLLAYVFNSNQRFLNSKITVEANGFLNSFKPGKSFTGILLYMLLTGTIFLGMSAAVSIGFAINGIFGILSLLLASIWIIRQSLVIPGIVAGGMSVSESYKYSLEQIHMGRSFKIMVFGIMLFIMLSLLMAALFFLPTMLFKTTEARLFFNIFSIFIQFGFISIGMMALFIRYANFEEVNIAE